MDNGMGSEITKKTMEKFREILIDIHKEIIEVSGGEQGIRDVGGLEHAIFEILKYGEKYAEINPFIVAARVYNMLATRHYFVDGNKRTSHIFAKLLLIDYGHRIKIKYGEAVTFIIEISQGKKNIEEIEEWLRKNSISLENTEDYIDEFSSEIEDMKKYMDSHS